MMRCSSLMRSKVAAMCRGRISLSVPRWRFHLGKLPQKKADSSQKSHYGDSTHTFSLGFGRCGRRIPICESRVQRSAPLSNCSGSHIRRTSVAFDGLRVAYCLPSFSHPFKHEKAVRKSHLNATVLSSATAPLDCDADIRSIPSRRGSGAPFGAHLLAWLDADLGFADAGRTAVLVGRSGQLTGFPYPRGILLHHQVFATITHRKIFTTWQFFTKPTSGRSSLTGTAQSSTPSNTSPPVCTRLPPNWAFPHWRNPPIAASSDWEWSTHSPRSIPD